MSNYIKPKEIYLQPVCLDCDDDAFTEREWCTDSDVWDSTCDNCGKDIEPDTYILKGKQ